MRTKILRSTTTKNISIRSIFFFVEILISSRSSADSKTYKSKVAYKEMCPENSGIRFNLSCNRLNYGLKMEKQVCYYS